MLTAIWAQDKNGLIGKNGELPWHIPEDLKFFKDKTLGSQIIMGRKTFEGMGSKPLPLRQTLVLTTNTQTSRFGSVEYLDMELLTSYLQFLDYKNVDRELFVVGGSSIYKELVPKCHTLIRTVIDYEFEGDTYFPENVINWNEWELIEEKNRDTKKYKLKYQTFKRK